MKIIIALMLLFCASTALAQDIKLEGKGSVGHISGYAGASKWNIRMLVLRHCPDENGVSDAALAMQAANLGASKGLHIKDLGDFRVNSEGLTGTEAKFAWNEQKYTGESLKEFIGREMKVDARPGDTFIVYTIGHGGEDGGMATLGQRSDFMNIVASLSEEQKQRTLWWQMSCHAAACLPPISSLPEKGQKLFTMIASSTAENLSYFGVEGEILQQLFVALAENSPSINPNRGNTITADDLRGFLLSINSGIDKLVFARSGDTVIFGVGGFPHVPIVDENNPQGTYPDDYVTVP